MPSKIKSPKRLAPSAKASRNPELASARSSIHRLLTVLILAVGLGACSSGDGDESASESPAQQPTTTGPDGDDGQPLIAYQTERGGQEGIWLVRPDGSGDHQIGADAAQQALLPDWSSDGTQLVFTTRGGETEPLHVYDLDTDRSTQLFECTDPCVGDDEPAYSPDDSQVAFIRATGPFVDDKPSECGLWIGDVATGEVHRVTSHPGCDPRETSPRWSPDGTQLTYWTERYDAAGNVTSTAVFVIGADGQGNRQLTGWETNAGDPDWSPDGDWIVYSTHPLRDYQCCEVSNLYRVHPDGSGAEALTAYADPGTRATQPRYTPDGTQILLTLVTDSRDLALMPSAGGDATPMTHGGIHTHGDMQPTP
jgi:Tol biopolymer transport system component